eukprot:129860-Pleurochrysis_carterae.AAC.1
MNVPRATAISRARLFASLAPCRYRCLRVWFRRLVRKFVPFRWGASGATLRVDSGDGRARRALCEQGTWTAGRKQA